MRTSWILLIVLCAALCLVDGNQVVGSGDDVIQKPTEDHVDSNDSTGWIAWLEHPEHVFEADLMQLHIRVFPDTNAFPGMKHADVARFDDIVIKATVKLQGIAVPSTQPQRAYRPQAHIQREKDRGLQARAFARRAIQNASGLLIVEPTFSETERPIACQLLLLDENGTPTNLASLLTTAGFAVDSRIGTQARWKENTEPVTDWGRRIPSYVSP